MNVFLADEQDEPVQTDRLRTLAEDVLVGEHMPEDTELALVLVGPGEMAVYNERFMEQRGATDVLAFPLEHLHPGELPATEPNGPPVNLGDVFVCPAVVRRNADAAGVAFEDELALIVIHGILHLLGYDHVEDDEAALMEARERELLAQAGRRRP